MLQFPLILTTALASASSEGGMTTSGQMMAAMGVLLLSFTMLTLLRRRMRRHGRNSDFSVQDRIRDVREQAQSKSGRRAPTSLATTAAKASVDAVMADAEELTRRLAALMDNKAATLEILIDRANESAERLERAGGSQTSQPSPLKAPPPDPVAEEIYALADQGMTSLDIARELDEPTGKVELILALRQPTQSSTTGAN